VVVRRATVEDAHAIAEMHVATWRAAYAHILPQEVLDGLDVGANADRKRRIVESGGNLFVAEQDGKIVGFAICGANRDEKAPCDGELQAIYVHPEAQGTGVGRSLLRAAVDQLCQEGYESMAVYLFRDNHQAKSFYTANGAEFHSEAVFELQGVKYPDECHVWHSLRALRTRLTIGER
jgi:ribosomal protein S18 acetylase RimI-like enzyme